MKYSIIIPVYNAQMTLNRCVDSIINQDYDDYELILVNDGSTDDSLKVCKEYANKNNIIVVDKKNGGASSARNAGINVAKGDFIIFVDSDDYVEDNFFEINENVSTDADFVLFAQRKKLNDEFLFQSLPQSALNNQNSNLFDLTKDLVLYRPISCPCAKIFKKSIIDKINLRFDENLFLAEDFIFGLEYLLNCQKVQLINSSVYVSDKTNDSSLTRGVRANLIEFFPLVFDKAFDIVDSSQFNDNQKTELKAVCDKLHVDSFVTCVLEEFKDTDKTAKQIKHNIKELCSTFYAEYSQTYGYMGMVHFLVRFCIKHRCVNLLYYLSKIYLKIRSRKIV